MDYFNQPTRIGVDKCGLTQDMLQNAGSSDYMLKNYYAQDCTMRRPVEFATSQVSINYNAAGGSGKQCGLGGCNIAEANSLSHTPQVRTKCRISLYQRPFLTIPYLGRGPFNPDLETTLKKSEAFDNRKSANPSSEVSYAGLNQYPLISPIRDTISNPKYLVESWTRGGDSSRMQRDSRPAR